MKKHAFLMISISTAILLLQGPPIAQAQERMAAPVTAESQKAAFLKPSAGLKADLDFGRMPPHFIANEGQLDERVAYYVQGKEKSLYFTPGGLTIVLSEAPDDGEENGLGRSWQDRPSQRGDHERMTEGQAGIKEKGMAAPSERWVVKLDFVGANSNLKPVGIEKKEAVVSYFKGRPEEWKTGLPTYSKIAYPELWPGIDLVYYGTFDRLKYEFIVHPGADPSRIRLAYRGATSVSVNAVGKLEVATPVAGFADDVPEAYQEIAGKRIAVPLAYRMEEEDSQKGSRTYGFRVGDYDKSLPLVLDPSVLIYCGYIGGSSTDYGRSIAVDMSGNAYIAGQAMSSETTFPVAVGPDLSHNGYYDVFVAKLNAAGTGFIYCGYIGGSGADDVNGIAVDGAGNAYIVGYTQSGQTEFPVTVGPDVTYNFNGDAFVAKVNSSGTALVYCGYIGGSESDRGCGIAVDGSGNAYIAGYTISTQATFPVVIGPDLAHNGVYDAFVAKVNPSGSALVYCGYIGGSQSDLGNAIAVDGAGNAYLAGDTSSTQATFPVVVGPDITINGIRNAFLAKVNPSGTALLYCGYIGGSEADVANAIAIDNEGNAYITGYSTSPESTFPVAVGPDLTHNGDLDAFVAKVNSSGTALVYCGYIGGSGADSGLNITVDGARHACLTGFTQSTQATFPVAGGPDLTHNGGYDGFAAKVNFSGTGLISCGYIGGSGDDKCYGIAVDSEGSTYVIGDTVSAQDTFPVMVGPDITYGGNGDAFVAKIFEEPIWKPRHAVGDFDGDGADEAAMDFGEAGVLLYDNGTWTQISSANPQGLLTAEIDGDAADEILADLGSTGLWLWNAGAWSLLSGVNAEGMAAGDVDADGSDEVIGDFGVVGLWLYDGGVWTQLSGVNADETACADLDGAGGEEIIGDFRTTGLWIWNAGAWTQLSGVNADYVAFGNWNGLGGQELAGDFGTVGLWLWSTGSGWTQLSGVNADYVIKMHEKGNAEDDLVGDFGWVGMWFWREVSWEQISGVDAEFMIIADVDGDGSDDGVVDFGSLGLWLGTYASDWIQLSGVSPEYMMAGDVDGDDADEVLADLGVLGVWLWNAGAWSQISTDNPE